MNAKKKRRKNQSPKAPKVRDLPARKDAKAGGGGIHIGPSGLGG